MKIRNSRTATAADESKEREREWGREGHDWAVRERRRQADTALRLDSSVDSLTYKQKGGSSAKGLQGLRPGQGQRGSRCGTRPAHSSRRTLPAVIQVLVK